MYALWKGHCDVFSFRVSKIAFYRLESANIGKYRLTKNMNMQNFQRLALVVVNLVFHVEPGVCPWSVIYEGFEK